LQPYGIFNYGRMKETFEQIDESEVLKHETGRDCNL
jgi:hypothetical protein